MSTKEKPKREAAMIARLFSTKADEVLQAFTEIHEKGNYTMVEPLLKTLTDWPEDESICRKAKEIIMEVKSENAIPILVEALENPAYFSQRAFILSVFWHAGLYPVDHVETLVKHALQGDYYVALESLTVLENMDAEPDEDLLRNELITIDEFIDENPNAGHLGIIKSIKELLTTKLSQ